MTTAEQIADLMQQIEQARQARANATRYSDEWAKQSYIIGDLSQKIRRLQMQTQTQTQTQTQKRMRTFYLKFEMEDDIDMPDLVDLTDDFPGVIQDVRVETIRLMTVVRERVIEPKP